MADTPIESTIAIATLRSSLWAFHTGRRIPVTTYLELVRLKLLNRSNKPTRKGRDLMHGGPRG